MNRVLIVCSISLFQIYFNNCLTKLGGWALRQLPG